ncbi:hypothetical protein LSAT2_014056 [Lamellibrachia satsuma]|nr:hypothetical protein LSAT2_014056 [Lamellibrachia satsuma]
MHFLFSIDQRKMQIRRSMCRRRRLVNQGIGRGQGNKGTRDKGQGGNGTRERGTRDKGQGASLPCYHVLAQHVIHGTIVIPKPRVVAHLKTPPEDTDFN